MREAAMFGRSASFFGRSEPNVTWQEAREQFVQTAKHSSHAHVLGGFRYGHRSAQPAAC